MKTLKIALIGAGQRGKIYVDFALNNPEKFKVVAIAEPVAEKREYMAKLHNVPNDKCFESWEELLNQPKMADIAIIATQDKGHYEPAMKAIELKYDLLLEKPVSVSAKECNDIAKAAQANNVKVVVCHVLRYTQFYKVIKKLIDDGRVGEIMNINHTEGVGNFHHSHSYVRGNWANTAESSPMILAKSCHDVDLVQWLIGEECRKVQSFGTLSYFSKKNMPEGATEYCMDGCPHKDDCIYYAPKLYLKEGPQGWGRDVAANKFNATDEEVFAALKKGAYGKCVFKCNNDVVDHQTLNMQFGEDKFVTFTMSAFNRGGRVTNIMGTKGEITANMVDSSVVLYDYKLEKHIAIMDPDSDFDDTIVGGHGGGDTGIMEDLYEYIANNNPSNSISDISVSVKNHLIAFAAEEARLTGDIIDLKKYENSLQ